MATIRFDNLKRTSVAKSQDYTYSDIHLDMETVNINSANSTLPTKGKDIIVDFDIAAIKNALFNLFNTIPGQKLLTPRFGLNVRQFLFEPITDLRARSIAQTIIDGVERWEPRVRVVHFNIDPLPELHQYNIKIAIEIPDLKEFTSVEGVISNRGFIVDQASTRDVQ